MGGPGSGPKPAGGKTLTRSQSRSNTLFAPVVNKTNVPKNASLLDGSRASKSPPQSPPDTTETGVILETLRSFRTEFTSEIAELRRDSREIRKAVLELQKMKQEITDLSTKTTLLSIENTELKKRIQLLESKEETRDKRDRKRNFIVRGLAEPIPTKPAVKKWLNDELQLNHEVEDVIPFKKAKPGTALVCMKTLEEKEDIMQMRATLASHKITITHDRTPLEREVQAKIRKIANEEEKKGSSVKIGYKKLTLNGQELVWVDGRGLQALPSKARDPRQRGDRQAPGDDDIENVNGPENVWINGTSAQATRSRGMEQEEGGMDAGNPFRSLTPSPTPANH